MKKATNNQVTKKMSKVLRLNSSGKNPPLMQVAKPLSLTYSKSTTPPNSFVK